MKKNSNYIRSRIVVIVISLVLFTFATDFLARYGEGLIAFGSGSGSGVGGGNDGTGQQGQSGKITIDYSLNLGLQGAQDTTSENKDEFFDGTKKNYSDDGVVEIDTGVFNTEDLPKDTKVGLIEFPDTGVTEAMFDKAQSIVNEGLKNGLSVDDINKSLNDAGIKNINYAERDVDFTAGKMTASLQGDDYRYGNYACVGLKYDDKVQRLDENEVRITSLTFQNYNIPTQGPINYPTPPPVFTTPPPESNWVRAVVHYRDKNNNTLMTSDTYYEEVDNAYNYKLSVSAYIHKTGKNYDVIGKKINNSGANALNYSEDCKGDTNTETNFTFTSNRQTKSVTFFLSEDSVVTVPVPTTSTSVTTSMDYSYPAVRTGEIKTVPSTSGVLYDSEDGYGLFDVNKNVPGGERLEFKVEVNPYLYDFGLSEIYGAPSYYLRSTEKTTTVTLYDNGILTEDKSTINRNRVGGDSVDAYMVENVKVYKLKSVVIESTNVNNPDEVIVLTSTNVDEKVNDGIDRKGHGQNVDYDSSKVDAIAENMKRNALSGGIYSVSADPLNIGTTNYKIGNIEITSDENGKTFKIKGRPLNNDELEDLLRGDSDILIDDKIEVAGDGIIPLNYGNGWYQSKCILTYENIEYPYDTKTF